MRGYEDQTKATENTTEQMAQKSTKGRVRDTRCKATIHERVLARAQAWRMKVRRQRSGGTKNNYPTVVS